LEKELAARVEAKIRADVTERILREAGLEEQVATAIAAIEKPDAGTLKEGIERLFEQAPGREWRDHIAAVVAKLVGGNAP
jgi:hypothetical protein